MLGFVSLFVEILSVDAEAIRTDDVAGVFRLGGRSGENTALPDIVRDRIGIRSGISGGRKPLDSLLIGLA